MSFAVEEMNYDTNEESPDRICYNSRMKINIIILTALSTILLISGCDWPRDNPLDPDGINYGITNPPDDPKSVMDITSFHSLQWYPSEDYYALEVVVSGDMTDMADSVIFIYDDTTCYQLTREGDIWRTSIESSIFPGNNLADLVGIPFISVLFHENDSIAATEEAYLFRVINTVPNTVQPSNNVEVSPNPEFTWLPVYENFSFTYLISIVNLSTSGYATEVASIAGIPKDSTAYTLIDPLPSGSYYWTVAIVDNFGNKSRSKEATFMVIE